VACAAWLSPLFVDRRRADAEPPGVEVQDIAKFSDGQPDAIPARFANLFRVIERARHGRRGDAGASADVSHGWGHSPMRTAETWCAAYRSAETKAADRRGYSRIVRGGSLSADHLQEWPSSRPIPTAVVSWMLGPEYSYQAVVLGDGRGSAAVTVRKRTLKTDWLAKKTEALQRAVSRRAAPPGDIFSELSLALLEPVADAIRSAEVVYLCPFLALNALPLCAFSLDGLPLAVQKRVAVVPTLSALHVWERIDRGKHPQPISTYSVPNSENKRRTFQGC